MAAGSRLDIKPNGGEVLLEAAKRIPFTAEEAELLSGGVPRGHKNLTKATADLVKAGWMTKGRSGWSITDNGLRATVAFNTVEKLVEALKNGTLIPAGTPMPENPAEKPSTTVTSVPAAGFGEAEVFGNHQDGRPEAVALAGNFGEVVGAPNWDPTADKLQMSPAEQGLWKLLLDLPAGEYSYKAVLNGSWDENYGAFGVRDGANHEFMHAGGPVDFVYNPVTNDVLRGGF
ncbi:glycosidase [Arthrobacter stackebrandtii]|nr:glycosidase [Arthrobacter stackebrandtii]PYG99216.1 glycosidase [Arthrobacter stackebrandtii]